MLESWHTLRAAPLAQQSYERGASAPEMCLALHGSACSGPFGLRQSPTLFGTASLAIMDCMPPLYHLEGRAADDGALAVRQPHVWAHARNTYLPSCCYMGVGSFSVSCCPVFLMQLLR